MIINVKPSQEYLKFRNFVLPIIHRNDYTEDPRWKVDNVMGLYEISNNKLLVKTLLQYGLSNFEVIKAMSIQNKRKRTR